jgi:hypothetical protein
MRNGVLGFFKLDESAPGAPQLIIGDQIRLNPASGDKEADAEGAAFDNGHFYAIGSHGMSRHKNEFQASRYSVYRIEPDGAVQASAALVPLLANVPGISEHFCTQEQRGSCQPLEQGGANIEGPLPVVEISTLASGHPHPAGMPLSCALQKLSLARPGQSWKPCGSTLVRMRQLAIWVFGISPRWVTVFSFWRVPLFLKATTRLAAERYFIGARVIPSRVFSGN